MCDFGDDNRMAIVGDPAGSRPVFADYDFVSVGDGDDYRNGWMLCPDLHFPLFVASPAE